MTPRKTPARKYTATKKTTTRKKQDITVFQYVDELEQKKGRSLVFRRADWYIPQRDGDGFLSGLKCGMCKLGFKTGQSVWAQQVQSSDYYNSRRVVAWHATCMRERLDRAPAEKYDEIRSRLAAGGGLFDD